MKYFDPENNEESIAATTLHSWHTPLTNHIILAAESVLRIFLNMCSKQPLPSEGIHKGGDQGPGQEMVTTE